MTAPRCLAGIGAVILCVCFLSAQYGQFYRDAIDDVLQEAGTPTIVTLPLKAFELKRKADDAQLMESQQNALPQATLYDFANTMYYSDVQIGTPPKSFKMVMDTGSQFLVVPDKVCKDTACRRHRKYVVHDSKTGKVLGVRKTKQGRESVRTGDIRYGSGGVEGVFATDKVSLAGVTVDMAVMAALRLSPVFAHVQFDGIFGLGQLQSKVQGHSCSFMDSAVKQRKLSKNIVSFSLPTTPGGQGSVVLGGIDANLFTGSMHWHPVVPSHTPMWVVKLRQFHIGNGPNLCKRKGCVAIVDTGTSMILTSKRIAKAAWSQLKINPDCSKAQHSPPVRFVFGGSDHAYILPGPAVTLEARGPSGKPLCTPAIRATPAGGATGGGEEMVSTSRYGMAKFRAKEGEDIVILGDIFFRRFYSAFDNSDRRSPKVGFALSTNAKND